MASSRLRSLHLCPMPLYTLEPHLESASYPRTHAVPITHPPPLCESSPRNGVSAHKSLTLLHAPHLGNSGPYCDCVRNICASHTKNEQQGIVNAPAVICCGNFDHAADPLCTVCQAYDGIRPARCSVEWYRANVASDDTLGALTVGGPVGPAPAATTRW